LADAQLESALFGGARINWPRNCDAIWGHVNELRHVVVRDAIIEHKTDVFGVLVVVQTKFKRVGEAGLQIRIARIGMGGVREAKARIDASKSRVLDAPRETGVKIKPLHQVAPDVQRREQAQVAQTIVLSARSYALLEALDAKARQKGQASKGELK